MRLFESGDGSLALNCLRRGIPYIGLTFTDEHVSLMDVQWLLSSPRRRCSW